MFFDPIFFATTLSEVHCPGPQFARLDSKLFTGA